MHETICDKTTSAIDSVIDEQHFELRECSPKQSVYKSTRQLITQNVVSQCQPTSLPAFQPASQEFTHRSVASGVTQGGHFVWLI